MQRQVLNTYSLVLARKINSSYFKVVPGGVKWTPGQDTTTFARSIKCNLRTLTNYGSNNSATMVLAMNPVKSTDSKSVVVNLLDTSKHIEPDDSVVDETENLDIEKKGGRKYRSSPSASLIDTQIKHEKDIQILLGLSLSPGLTLRGACQIIFRLGQLVQDKTLRMSITQIQQDDRFKDICKLIQKGNHSQVPHSLLQAIRGLENLGFTSDGHSLIQELENELKWSLRRCPIKSLARAIEILSNGKIIKESTENSQMSKISIGPQDPLYFAIQTLQRRWTEVSSGEEFLMVFKIINHLASETREKLEDRAVELVQEFSHFEMLKMFVALAGQKRRPTPLLRAMAFHLAKTTDKIPVKDLIELVYSLNELTFADPVLMQKICTDLQTEIESVKNSSWISSLATSLGQMRYLHKELMESMEEWISKHLMDLRPFDCASWLLASSVFYLNTNKQQEFFATAKSKLSQEIVNPMEWLNIVHALVILDQATLELVSSVLKPEFVKKIDSLNESNSAARVKLLNVNAIAKKNIKLGGSSNNYNGPLLTNEFVTKWMGSTGENDLHLTKVVLESLSNFLPPPKYLRSSIKTESGVFIDAICILNEKTDPIPIDSLTIKGAIKVAILVQGYPVMCLGMKVSTGSSVLNIKLLENEGYRVICVPYTEFSPKEKLLRRVQYLEQKVRNINSSDKETTNLQHKNNIDSIVNR